jgi:DNA-binding Xre family transcriptional regulator
MKVVDGVSLDHKDGNGLDNRKKRLRVADHAQNGWNQKIRICGKSSRYKGVIWHIGARKWQSQIRYKGRLIHLGTFDDEAEAAKAYDEAAEKHFGVFARLNFPAYAAALAGKPQEQKMSYLMDEKTRKQTEKRISELKGYNGLELAEILRNRTMGELENMCKVLECNISELSMRIRRS